MADVQIFRYRNNGDAVGAYEIYAGTHEESLDGTDKLEVTGRVCPRKNDRMVWKDNTGVWHEHIVDTTERTHSGGIPSVKSTCLNSIAELAGVPADKEKPQYKGTVKAVLKRLLDDSGCRWTVDGGSSFDNKKYTLETWHKSVRECIAELVDMCGGELVTTITVGGYKVKSRAMKIVEERGSDVVKRQFSWGANMTNVKRVVSSDDVFTGVIGYGAKLKKDDDDSGDDDKKKDEVKYDERLKVVVESDSSTKLQRFGTPLKNGMAHSYMVYTDSNCDDADFLRRQCRSLLKYHSKQQVRYEFDVYQIDDDTWKDVKLGNKVQVVDDDLSVDEIERISFIKRNLVGLDSCRIIIGDRPSPIVKKFKAAERTSKKTTGNSLVSASTAGVLTLGNYGEGAGGDTIVHKLDGVELKKGVIEFTTAAQ